MARSEEIRTVETNAIFLPLKPHNQNSKLASQTHRSFGEFSRIPEFSGSGNMYNIYIYVSARHGNISRARQDVDQSVSTQLPHQPPFCRP